MYEPADLSIYILGKGLVLKEKSLVAYERASGKIVAAGTEAGHFSDNPQGDILVCSPLRQGTVADYVVAVGLFTCLLHKALGKKPFRKPAVAICVPGGMTQVEIRAVEDAVRQAGAGEIMVSDIPVGQFVKELPEKSPNLSRKFRVAIGIGKDDPERYIRERLSDALCCAKQAGISAGRVAELLGLVEEHEKRL